MTSPIPAATSPASSPSTGAALPTTALSAGIPASACATLRFVITTAERDAWLRHMLTSLDAVTAARATPAEPAARIRTYLTDVADFLVNTR